MTPHLYLFATLAIALCPIPSFGQDSLRVLSWNVQMLPLVINNNGKAKRAKVIVEELKKHNYDVIVFQEVFKHRSRRIIRNGLLAQFPNQTQVLNKKTIAFKSNGGVMILSRHRILKTHQIRYKERTGFDKLSRKGALLAELDFHDRPVQIIGTHLQAFGAAETMNSQYQQLYDELLKPYSRQGVAQIICGDFNTIKTIPPVLPAGITQSFVDRLPRYHQMIKTLDADDGDLHGDQQYTMDRPYNDLCKARKEYRLLLDYILLRNQGGSELKVFREVKIMRKQWHKDHQDLSDHYGLEAIISNLSNPN